MPLPLSPKSGLGMNVADLPWALATLRTMCLYHWFSSAFRRRVLEAGRDLALAAGGHLVVMDLEVEADLAHLLGHFPSAGPRAGRRAQWGNSLALGGIL